MQPSNDRRKIPLLPVAAEQTQHTILADRRLEGIELTRNESGWKRVPDSIRYALQRICHFDLEISESQPACGV